MSNPRPHQGLKLRAKCMPVIHNGTLVSVRQPGPTTCGVQIHSQIAVADLYRTVSASRCSDRKFKGGKNTWQLSITELTTKTGVLMKGAACGGSMQRHAASPRAARHTALSAADEFHA